MTSILGLKAVPVNATFASKQNIDTAYYMYEGIEYRLTSKTQSTNRVAAYVLGDADNYVYLNNGNVVYLTPNVSGYLRLYNTDSYVGEFEVDVAPYYMEDGILSEYHLMITNAATLSDITNGSNSVDDFPANKIVCVGATNIGLLNYPTGNSTDRGLGVYITFDGRGHDAVNGRAQLVIGLFGCATRWYTGGAWSTWKTFALPGELSELSEKTLQRYKQYDNSSAWLADFPSNKIADIPTNRIVCIGSTSVGVSDAPDNFAGNVITLSANATANPGAVQIALNLMENAKIYIRRYIYNANGNYWGKWLPIKFDNIEYHVGTGQAYTSFVSLLLDLAGDESDKIIYIHDGEYDLFAEYMAEVQNGRLTVPPDNVESGDYFGTYNAFVPNNTKIVGLGNVTLKMMPEANEISYGASRTWSPLNILGSVEIENITVEAHNCRYALHNDDHGAYPNSKQHYKNVRFHYYDSDTNASNQKLGFGHCIGFGIYNSCTHFFEHCEMTNTSGAGYCVYYGHESSAGNNGSLILRHCRIQSGNYNNACTVRLQTLARNVTGKVTATFENCYINGGIELNPYYTDSIQSFVVTLSQTNKVTVSRRNSQNGTIVDPYTLTWINPLATPTAQAPLIETDSYSG